MWTTLRIHTVWEFGLVAVSGYILFQVYFAHFNALVLLALIIMEQNNTTTKFNLK